MVSIVCLKWGNKYSSEYVNKLYAEVCKYVTIPHEFICFTENSSGVKAPTSQLPDLKLTGWWNKMWLFNPSLPVKYERIFYMDITTVILDNIDSILSNLTDDFYIAENWWKTSGEYASGLMSWKKGNESLWEKFRTTKHRPGHGDQGFIEHYRKDVTYFQDVFPDMFVSYKAHYLKGQRGKMIYFHGNPRADTVKAIWDQRPNGHN